MLVILINTSLSYYYSLYNNRLTSSSSSITRTTSITSTTSITTRKTTSTSTLQKKLYMSNNNKVSEDERDKIRGELLELCDKFTENQKSQWNYNIKNDEEKEEGKGLFGATSRLAGTINLDDDGKKVVNMIEEFVKLNPTNDIFYAWKTIPPPKQLSQCPLDGTWKLRFTTASDATFKPGKRGPATTLQIVNATTGMITNIIDFNENKGKVKGFQVIIEAIPLPIPNPSNRIDLIFKGINIQRKSRLLPKISLSLAPLRFIGKVVSKLRKKQRETPYMEVLYVDDDCRIHKTGDGNYFVQTRLYEAWDPAIGWTLVTGNFYFHYNYISKLS